MRLMASLICVLAIALFPPQSGTQLPESQIPTVKVPTELPPLPIPAVPEETTTTTTTTTITEEPISPKDEGNSETKKPQQETKDSDSPGVSDNEEPEEKFPVRQITPDSVEFGIDENVGTKLTFSTFGLVVGFLLGLFVQCLELGRNDDEE
jgi:hypothetical protein